MAAPKTQPSAEQIADLTAPTHFGCPVALELEHSSQTEANNQAKGCPRLTK